MDAELRFHMEAYADDLVRAALGASRLDPVTYLGVIALLAGVSVVACGVPARRASRVDPMIALRHE